MKYQTGDIIEINNKEFAIMSHINYKKEDYFIVSEFYEQFELKKPNIFMIKQLNDYTENDTENQIKIITNQKEIENVLKQIKI